jgi:hypothetical protein
MLSDAHQRNHLVSEGRADQRSLLSYYSSETTAHATNLVAVSLVILTALQIFLNAGWNGRLILAVVLFIFSATGVWMVGKMMYWAALASAIMYVPAGEHRGSMGELHNQATIYVRDKSQSRITKLSNNFRSLSWDAHGLWVAVVVGIFVTVAVWLLLPEDVFVHGCDLAKTVCR